MQRCWKWKDIISTLILVGDMNMCGHFQYHVILSLRVELWKQTESCKELGKERGRSEEVKNDAWEFQSESC